MKNVLKGIKIDVKSSLRGDDEHKVISLRIPNKLFDMLNKLADETNRSRNNVINLLLESALKLVKVEGLEHDERKNMQIGVPPQKTCR